MGRKKNKKLKIDLTPEEHAELESIIDRLKLQHPQGETFNNFVESLIERLSEKENLLAALIDRISREPSEAGVELILKVKDKISSRHKRILKRALFRLIQRGYLTEKSISSEEVSDSSKVVLIPNPSQTENVLSGIYLHDIQYSRFLTIILPPTPTTEATLIAVTESPESNRLECRTAYGSKRELNAIIKQMEAIFKFYEAPLYHVAQLMVNRIEVFSKMLNPASREGAFEIKRIVREFLPDDPEKFFKESFKNTKDNAQSPDNLVELISEVKKFEFDLQSKFASFVTAIDSVLNPTIMCSEDAKLYRLEKKILEFFDKLNEFSIGRYYLFLTEEVTRLISSSKIQLAAQLYNIARCVKNRDFDKISSFLTKHLLYLTFREAFVLEIADLDYYKNSPYFAIFGEKIDMVRSWASKLSEGCMELIADVIDEETEVKALTGSSFETESMVTTEKNGRYKRLESGLYVPNS